MSEKITSAKNPKIKTVKEILRSAKARRESGMFAAEGLRLCPQLPADAVAEIWLSESLDAVLSAAEGSEEGGGQVYIGQLSEWLGRCSCPVYTVPDTLFSSISGTVTPQGVLALAHMRHAEVGELAGGPAGSQAGGPESGAGLAPSDRKLLVLLEGIQDPGNLGTIFRTAEAAGVSGLIMDHACTDVYSPKTVRAAMGSSFRLPFAFCDDMPDLVRRLASGGWTCLAADPRAETDFREAVCTERTAILIGNEGNGLSADALAAATLRVSIPMQGEAESLNAAVAAALMMYMADFSTFQR